MRKKKSGPKCQVPWHAPFLIAAVFAVLGGIVFFTERAEDTVSRGYLLRGSYGSGGYTETLGADIDGEKQEIEVTVDAREYTKAEAEKLLDEAAASLEKTVLQDTPAGHVDRDLVLPSSLPDSPVKISWTVTPPDFMDYEGTLTSAVPEEGAGVQATAELACQDELRTVCIFLKVFPKVLSETERLQQKVKETVGKEDAANEKIVLPSAIDGHPVSWSRAEGSTGMAIAGIGIAAAALYAFSRRRNREAAGEKRRKQMMLDYPHIISKLVLLLNAGMSMRTAFARMTADYRSTLARNGRIREGFEEIARTVAEMERGVPETEAYRHLGERADLLKYRTLATLLAQNLRHGSRELANLLEQEADSAFEERKKQARILGEEAGTKLLLPMFLMLIIVMAILMVPAFVSFA